MKRIKYLLMMCVIALTATAQTSAVSSIVEKDGVYFTDATQTKLYTGDYREYYDNGSLKLEMHIKNGAPEGTYVVYFDNNKPKEIRSYKNGQFEDCIKYADTAISRLTTRNMHPTDTEAMYFKGLALTALGREKEAYDILSMAAFQERF